MPAQLSDRQKTWLIIAGLVLLTALAFSPVRHADFVNLDDRDYILENPPVLAGLSAKGVMWAFTTGHAANWHPITWLSHMLDVQLFGLTPAGHHLVSVGFHVANAILLFLLLNITTKSRWRSAVVAGLFALHPLRAESVAWVAERKDVLSLFFGLLCLLAYWNYTQKFKVRGPKFKVWYGVALLLFALGLMSKPMLVTWPCLMLLLDYWPLRRAGIDGWRVMWKTWRGLVIEKIPFFCLTLVSCVITILVQKHGGAVASLESHAFTDRLGNAAVACLRYVGKTFWPAGLAVYYPHPGKWPMETVLLSALGLVLITFAVLRFTKHRQFLFVGWVWFLVTLSPVIGIIQVGGQSMADRYTYIPTIGLLIIVVWVAAEVLARQRAFATALSILVLAANGMLLHRQVQLWTGSEKLFAHTVAVTPPNFMARFCLGNTLIDAGRVEEGAEQLNICIQLNPSFPNAHGKLAYLATGFGKYGEAVAHYQEALRLRPDFHDALNNLAWLLATCPDATIRNGSNAVAHATRACELTGFQKTLYIGTLAAAYAEAGRFEEAIATGLKAEANALNWNETELAKRNAQLVEEYRKGRPHHESLP